MKPSAIPSPLHVILAVLLCACLVHGGAGIAHCDPGAKPKRLLIVNSYEPGQICGQPQEDGLLAALAAEGFTEGAGLLVERFYMDTRLTHTTPEQISARGHLALERIRDFGPDLVVTLDDSAARTVMLPLAGGAIPVVFSGINTQPEEYHQRKPFMASRERPGGNVTGVYEKLHIASALDVMRTLTGLRRAAVIVDATATGQAVTRQIQHELATTPTSVAMSYFQVADFEDFKGKIRAFNEDAEIGAVYSVAFTLKAADGRTVGAEEILTWQLANLHKPDMAVNYFLSHLGMFGGATVDFRAMGEQAGRQAAAILRGTPAGDIAIEDAAGQALVFNLERARQLGITIPIDILSAADILYDDILLRTDQQAVSLLVVQSYEKGTGCGAMIEPGLLEELARAGYREGERLQLHHFHMDTQNTHITREAIIRQARLALAEIERLRPDIIVLMDDNAVEHVLPPLLDTAHPVFVAGTNVPLEHYNAQFRFMDTRQHPGKNVTGVTEEHDPIQTLRLIKSLVPQARTAVTIYADATPFIKLMGEANEAYIERHRDSLPLAFLPPVKVTRFSDYQALIKKYDNDPTVDLIYTFAPVSLLRDDGSVVPARETINWMAQNQKKPGFTWMTNWVEAGYLASVGIDLRATGRTLAGKIVKVLHGARPGDLPIENPVKYSIALNLERAERLGLVIPVEILEAAEEVYPRPTRQQR